MREVLLCSSEEKSNHRGFLHGFAGGLGACIGGNAHVSRSERDKPIVVDTEVQASLERVNFSR